MIKCMERDGLNTFRRVVPERRWLYGKQLLLLILLLGVGGFWFWWSERGDWAARVNGFEISRACFEDEVARAEEFVGRVYGLDLQDPEAKELRDQVRQEVLQQLIDRVLLRQAASRLKIEVTPAEVEARVAADEARSGGPREFRRTLNTHGLTREQYQDKVQEMLVIEKLWNHLTRDVTVRESEVKDTYHDRKENLVTPEQVKVGHILVNSVAAAQSIITALDEGADFQELAGEYSLDPGVLQNKGILGYIGRDDPRFPATFREAAFRLPVGGYTKKPVRSELGYHVIIVLDKKKGTQTAYQDVREALKKELLASKKNQVFLGFLQRLRGRSRIMKRRI